MEAWIGGMIGAVVGVSVGHVVNHLLSVHKQNKQETPEKAFICIELIFHLESYVHACLGVVNDYSGQFPVSQGLTETMTEPTIFDYSLIKGNWKAIEPKMMFDICSLSPMHKLSLQRLEGAHENCRHSSEGDYFIVRQKEYSLLGAAAMDLACNLRVISSLPVNEYLTEACCNMYKIADLYKEELNSYKIPIGF